MFTRLLAVSAVALGLTLPAQAAPISFANTPGGLYSTGIAGSNYTFSFVNPSMMLVSGPAITGTPGNFPLDVYDNTVTNNPTLSQWVLTQANTGPNYTDAPGATYTFSTTFTLPTDLVSAAVSGQFAADNTISSIILNGNAIPVGGNQGAFQNGFQAFNLSSGFQPGLNTLSFVVTNGPETTGNPVGLIVQIDSAAATTPEPATLAVFGALGLAGAGYIRRRKAIATA